MYKLKNITSLITFHKYLLLNPNSSDTFVQISKIELHVITQNNAKNFHCHNWSRPPRGIWGWVVTKMESRYYYNKGCQKIHFLIAQTFLKKHRLSLMCWCSFHFELHFLKKKSWVLYLNLTKKMSLKFDSKFQSQNLG